ncbi:MAG: transposase, partial [Acidobacteriaceae bacterium]|nr:transposase [Acidobacteriaceae bacterium]
FKALESDPQSMGPALHLTARLYAVEERAQALALSAPQRFALRQRVSARLLKRWHTYLQQLQEQILPKSPAGAAVRYSLNQWEALTRFLQDGELEIDNGAAERANRDIAVGRGNWTFFGSDHGGQTAAVLRTSIASCQRCGIEPWAWFSDVLSRIPTHSMTRLSEFLPQHWKPLTRPAEG